MFIAIASHQRPIELQEKTLALLKKHKFEFKNVFVFVSPESYDEYLPVSKQWKFKLVKVPGKGSILTSRNYIIQYFNEGVKIVEMDDDIEDIETTLKGTPNKSVSDLKQLFMDSFKIIGANGLWGFNANTNNFYADGKDKIGLYSIINTCCGYINRKSIKLTVSEKEDFQRCILMFKLGHPILKRGGFGIKTKYWTNKGGIMGRYGFEKRKQVQSDSAMTLMKKYPEYCYTKVRPNGIVDIRFRRLKHPLTEKSPNDKKKVSSRKIKSANRKMKSVNRKMKSANRKMKSANRKRKSASRKL
jgi:hypothetical protein